MTSPSWRCLSAAELEKQYQPSAWVRRVAPSEAVRRFVETVTAQSQVARRSLACRPAVQYGPGPEQRYRELGTDLADDAPLAVYIHGGFWQELSLDISDGAALGFHQLGWRTVTVGYDLAPAVTLDDIVQQVRTAGRLLLARARDLGSRAVLLFGHSAGAQLAASLLADWSTLAAGERPLAAAVVHLSGVFDLEPLVATTVNDALRLDSAAARRHSPLASCDALAQLPGLRHVVLVGQHDSPEFVRQSRQYAAALAAAGCRAALRVVEGRDHFDICEALGEPGSEVLRIAAEEVGDVLAAAGVAVSAREDGRC